eukprot:scaffold55054_cov61-Phaeocystis_antarctica.AAC.1
MVDACCWTIAGQSARAARAHALAANLKPQTGQRSAATLVCSTTASAASLIPRNRTSSDGLSTASNKTVGSGQSGNLRHRCRQWPQLTGSGAYLHSTAVSCAASASRFKYGFMCKGMYRAHACACNVVQSPEPPSSVLKGVFSPNTPFLYERARLAPYELTHVRASPGDCAASLAQAWRKI